MVIHEIKHPTEALQNRIDFLSTLVKEMVAKQNHVFSSRQSSSNQSLTINKFKAVAPFKYIQ